jgi:DNA-binding transcriptional regulator PaaX
MDYKKRENIKNITETILQILGAVSVLTVAVIAPNILMIFDKLGKKHGKYDYHRFKRNLYYLKNKGYVKTKNNGGETMIYITQKGIKKYYCYKTRELKITKPKNWDKKWRIVIADIPEEKRPIRNVFRRTLVRIGFCQLQKSVWVHPYECQKEIEFLKDVYELKNYLYFIIADKIDCETKLKKYFEL